MNTLNDSLTAFDPDIAALIDGELRRQESGLEMIASENYAPLAVMQAQGSVLTNKYAEGYPGRRYYGGCEFVDGVEQLAIDRVKALFGAEYANVQPHSGATANAATMHALCGSTFPASSTTPPPTRCPKRTTWSTWMPSPRQRAHTGPK